MLHVFLESIDEFANFPKLINVVWLCLISVSETAHDAPEIGAMHVFVEFLGSSIMFPVQFCHKTKIIATKSNNCCHYQSNSNKDKELSWIQLLHAPSDKLGTRHMDYNFIDVCKREEISKDQKIIFCLHLE